MINIVEREQRISALLEDRREAPKYLAWLMVKTPGRIILLDVNNINWIKAEGNYVQVHNGQKSFLIRETISNLEARLDPKAFLRIHRSTIVRINQIKELQPSFHGDYRVILHSGTRLTLSRNYRGSLLRLFGQTL